MKSLVQLTASPEQEMPERWAETAAPVVIAAADVLGGATEPPVLPAQNGEQGAG
jgi:hypothetical protein